MDAKGAMALDERSRKRLDEGRRIYAVLAQEHERVFGDVLRDPGVFDGAAYNRAARRWSLEALIRDLTAEQSRCLFFAAAERLAASGDGDFYALPVMVFERLASGPPPLPGPPGPATALPLDLGPGAPAEMASVLGAVLGQMMSGGLGAPSAAEPQPRVIDWLGLTAADIALLAAVSEPGKGMKGARPFYLVVGLVEEMLARNAPGAVYLAEAVAARVAGWHVTEFYTATTKERGHRTHIARLRDHALRLAGYPPPPHAEGPVAREDAWGLAVIDRLGPVEDWPAGLVPLLEHCVQPTASRPSARWQKVCRQRLDAVGDASGLVRGLLDLLLTTEPVSFRYDHDSRSLLVNYNEPLARGLVWACGVLDPDWLPETLRAVAVRCLRLCAGSRFHDAAVPGEKIPHACFHALAISGSRDALMALARIGRATTNRGVHKLLEKTLTEVAERRGTSAAALMDRLLPDHGIGADGTVELGDGWLIRLDDREGAVLLPPSTGPSEPSGSSAPDGADAALAEIRATVALARGQQEAMFAARRELHVADFADDYLGHPVRGWLATRLAWTFTPVDGHGSVVRGFPDPTGTSVRTPDGVAAIPDSALVMLTHPVTLEAAELAALRTLAASLGVSQPVRQLWRETFAPTPGERQAGLQTDRYAGHVLRFRQCYGLARSRGWGGGFLYSGFDGGQHAVARKEYPSAGLRASWSITQAFDADTDIELCRTGELSFSALRDVVPAPVPLAGVPAEVFSEAMRDLALIVSATTVANDPLWLDAYSGQPLLDAYWSRAAAGGLEQLRTHRRAALESAAWVSGPRFSLTDTDLVVRGSLATYRIDLATANVRMEPAGKWLSFDSRPPAAALLLTISGLPVLDDDEILRRVLIRAAILADDETLASRKLLKQIRG